MQDEAVEEEALEVEVEVEEALEVEGEENMRQLLDRALFQVQWTFLSAVSCVICVVQCAVCSRPRHY